jgi:hypothetical protein
MLLLLLQKIQEKSIGIFSFCSIHNEQSRSCLIDISNTCLSGLFFLYDSLHYHKKNQNMGWPGMISSLFCLGALPTYAYEDMQKQQSIFGKELLDSVY